MPKIELDDPCPCESGQPARNCCFFAGVCEPREADTRPKGPRTGHALARCYAASLNDCSTQITGEHFITENVLRELAGVSVSVRGFPWQKATPLRIGVASLESKILCGRHNYALSVLDAQAGRFFRTIRAFGDDIGKRAGGTQVRLFPGPDIERWLLKASMGLVGSGNAQTSDGLRIAMPAAPMWSRILFGEFGFPPTWGLYVKGGVGETLNMEPGNFWIGPFMTDGSWLAAL